STEGVSLAGDGTLGKPYVIAGWNTTSISISGSVTANYELLNNWVQGSSSDGISISTTNSQVSIISDTSIHNAGNGIYVSSPIGASISSVSAINNGKNGIVVANNTPGQPLGIALSAAANNTENGIVVENAYKPSVTYSGTAGNGEDGIKVYNSLNASVDFNIVTNSKVGIEVTGLKASYGTAAIEANSIYNDGTGILVNGLGQVVTDPTSASVALVEGNAVLNSSVGLSAINQSVVEAALNTFGLNSVGLSFQNSLPLVISNLIAENVNQGVSIVGGFSSNETCDVTFVNQTRFSYDSCIAGNLFASTGSGDGLVATGLNNSLIYGNSALFNGGRGYALENVTESTIRFNFAADNSKDGFSITDSSQNVVAQNEFMLNQNGLAIYGGKGDQISKNNVTLNSFSGIFVKGSTEETITSNLAANNSYANVRGSFSAGGISLAESSGNSITKNVVQNNTGSTSVGYGIVLENGSDYNYLFQNNVTNNEAGIGLSNSISNLVTRNVVQNNRYGIYYTYAVNNSVALNTLSANTQDVYPDQPSVVFTSPTGNPTVDGTVRLSWQTSGQAIVYETISVDGSPTIVSGTAYDWNTAPLADGAHTVTILVENSGGFTATASIKISTDNQLLNNRTITVNLVGPGGLVIGNTLIHLSNSSMTLNGTTDSSGSVSFRRLHVGSYFATYGVNSSVYTATIVLSRSNNVNPSVVLFVPVISTTFSAFTTNGQSILLAMKGNVTSAEMKNAVMSNANGLYSLSFTASVVNESAGSSTITVPKSLVPAGLVPSITMDGSKQTTSYTQDKSNYYVTFFAPQGTHSLNITFSSPLLLHAKYIVVIVAVIAALLIAFILTTRRRRTPPFMR
ncbi:MAG: right-handed parallel beta-helix repeat-containing protein, partial [Nitrososphaerota archaeon]|nr:right-handed parallel beta-helix repeat-containing protein [Nitrososphaerota archaeon]